ncbi:MAG: hypothetical protein C4547_01420 [Phycisphaerales bacterium]|nr:MAG: hypothetical protein C4547_01420 [Phycisphaerales bacterium]
MNHPEWIAAYRRAGASRRLLTCVALLLAVASAAAAPPEKVALVGARIIPVVGPDVDRGTLLIEHGRIAAIGKDVKIPYDAMEVDVSGKVLFPGMIDPHSWRGLDQPNESLPVMPYLDVYDATDPSRLFFENALRDGITTVHVVQGNDCVIGGVTRVVRPIGLSLAEMTVAERVGIKLSTSPKRGFDRMLQMATLREAFLELDDYLERLAEQKYEEKLSKKEKKIDVGPKEARQRGRELIEPSDYDDAHANLVQLTRGQIDAWIYAGAATDVAPAIKIARDHGFLERTVLVLGPECFKAVDDIKASGRPVVLDDELVYRERDPLTGKLTETFVPKVFADAGVKFALQPSPDASLPERYLNYQAARCVREGLSRDAALRSITMNPAEAIGLGDRLGSLEVGKTANVVVLSGDPLNFNSWVEYVYIDGIRAYDRSKDPRLAELLGEEPEGEKKPPAEGEKEKKAEEDPAAKPDAAGNGKDATQGDASGGKSQGEKPGEKKDAPPGVRRPAHRDGAEGGE